MNREIIRYVSLNGPSIIYKIAKDMSSRSETKIHYPTVNRRVHNLLEREYLRKSGTVAIKSGSEAIMYETTIRGDFGSLATDLNPVEQSRLIGVAGLKPRSPFQLLRFMIERGLTFEFVQREFLKPLTEDIKNGYINIEALNEEVICSAFAASIARRLRIIMGEKEGKEYVEQVLNIVQSLILPSDEKIFSKPESLSGLAGAGASLGGSAQAPSASPAFSYSAKMDTRYQKPKRSQNWISELEQIVEEML